MIIIKVSEEIDRFLDKCLKNNINLYKIDHHKDYLIAKIEESNLESIQKLNYYSEIEVLRILGFKGKLLHIKKYLFDYFLLGVFLILLFIISNIVVSVEIKHENKDLINQVNEILINKGIVPFRAGKTLGELNQISENILEENRDILDWISINKIGMKYIVSFEERILTQEQESHPYCHVIAKKSGIISKIIAKSGETLVEVGSYVNVGDILITGEVILNEEVKDNICASGDVYAETWYKITVTVPYEYEIKEYTNKSRYNFILNGNYFYRKNYETYEENSIFKFKNFKVVEQKEYQLKKAKRSKEEAKNIAINAAKEKLLDKIGQNTEIIEQNVLKESENNSKIELEVFLSVHEQISKQEYFEVGGNSDTKQSIRYTN